MKSRLFRIRYLEEDGIRIVFRRDLPVRIDREGSVLALRIDPKDPFGKSFAALFTGRSTDEVRRRFIHGFMTYVRLTLLIRKVPGMHNEELEDREELRDLIQGIEVYRPKDRRGQKPKWYAKRMKEKGIVGKSGHK